MYCHVCTGALQGIYAYLVQAEVDAAQGLPGLELVGYLAGEVKEARERVRVALKNAGVDLPPMKITVNLSPADVRKDGTGFDLPIAVGILGALGKLSADSLENTLFIGELGLSGELKRVKGVLPVVQEAARQGVKRCILPSENAVEGGVVQGIEVIGAENISQLMAYLCADEKERQNIIAPTVLSPKELLLAAEQENEYDFADVVGQEMAKRGAVIAAAGFHNMLMIGPPGTGKTMVGKRIPGILPPMTLGESLEVSAIYSVQGLLNGRQALVTHRPFIQPHHTISAQALAGGGHIPKPGAVSLAHRGVLFLDEFPEFPKVMLDILRQPLEDKKVVVSRAYGSFQYPADFMLVAAMNPCPCGYFPNFNKCGCSEREVRRYLGHVSGPILDRMDIAVEVQDMDIRRLAGKSAGSENEAYSAGRSSADMRAQVTEARRMQEQRFAGCPYHFNSEIRAGDMRRFCKLGMDEERMLEQILGQQGGSARAYHRILKVARTIADLEGSEQITRLHLSEALCYRQTEGKYWRGRKS